MTQSRADNSGIPASVNAPAPALPAPGTGERFPYPPASYLGRALWRLVWYTLWQLCPKRVRFLRPLILRVFGADVHPRVQIAGSARFEIPWDLRIAENVTVSPRVVFYNLGGIDVGPHTIISQDVYLCGGTHDYTDPAYPLLRRKIVVGPYVWIAAGAFIGPGVTIGEGAVVGARAVVVKDVDPWTVVAGNPARVVNRRRMRGPSGGGDAEGDAGQPARG